MDNKKIAKNGNLVKSDVNPVEGKIVTFEGFNKLGEIRKAVNEAQREYLRKTLFPTLNDQDVLLVLYRAHNLHLDVLNQEMTAYKTSKGQLVMIVGKDAKMRRAKETGKLEKFSCNSLWRIKDEKTGTYRLCSAWEGGELWGAWAELKRKDEIEAHRVEVALKEYNQGNTMWSTKPETMIKKVSKSQVVTEAFPELFAGIYEEEEMPSFNGIGRVEKELPKLVNGEDPADSTVVNTIKTLMKKLDEEGSVPENLNKNEAALMVRDLTIKIAQQSKKKKEPENKKEGDK